MNGLVSPGSFDSQSVPGERCFLVLESLPFFTPEAGLVDRLYPSNCCCTDFCPVPDEIAGKSTALLNFLLWIWKSLYPLWGEDADQSWPGHSGDDGDGAGSFKGRSYRANAFSCASGWPKQLNDILKVKSILKPEMLWRGDLCLKNDHFGGNKS